jgi:hypothetical protein
MACLQQSVAHGTLKRTVASTMQKPIAICVLFLAVVQPSSLLHASEKTYEGGKLLSVYSPDVPFPLPLPLGQTSNLVLHLSYQFEVQQGDTVYVGYCQRSEYRPEWKVGDDVQFRLRKDKMYLKRANGKELMLVFLLSAKLGADGKPTTILKYKKQ